MNTKRLIIFIDIDGVIRPTGNPPGKISNSCLEQVRRLINYTDADVVISSTWRHLHEVDYFQKLFNDRVIGVTPQMHDHQCTYVRYEEIKDFLNDRGLQSRPWIAIDDTQDKFPVKDNIFMTTSELGFNSDTLKRIVAYLHTLNLSVCRKNTPSEEVITLASVQSI